MISFLYFRSQKCDYVVVECGMGARLDATNVIQEPACTAITSIGLDHMEILGDTTDKIAFEKAGIIKQGVPVVIGPSVTQECVKEIAEKKGSRLI